MNKLHYLLALNRIQVGSRTLSKLQKRWPNLQEMFQLSAHNLEQQGLPAALAHKISTIDLQSIDVDLLWREQSPDHYLMSWEDPLYPPLLKEIADPPIVLYLKGQLSALSSPKIAIVGSRNPSITGTENAKFFARELAQQALTIVSGLALGIDGQAHIGALEAKGQTIGVLGTGIDHIYPRRHLKLAEQMSEKGLIISEFPLKTPPIARHFPLRNRIISGLSLVTLVIEAALKSGSLITARMAMEQNRDVLAIPGSIHNPLARGCHQLVQEGAKLVTSVQDVLDELRIEHQPLASAHFPLASGNENLVKFMGFEMTSIDQLIARSGYPVEQVLTELATLELSGIITSVPGGYIRCEL